MALFFPMHSSIIDRSMVTNLLKANIRQESDNILLWDINCYALVTVMSINKLPPEKTNVHTKHAEIFLSGHIIQTNRIHHPSILLCIKSSRPLPPGKPPLSISICLPRVHTLLLRPRILRFELLPRLPSTATSTTTRRSLHNKPE